jgi:hypothetical protein
MFMTGHVLNEDGNSAIIILIPVLADGRAEPCDRVWSDADPHDG